MIIEDETIQSSPRLWSVGLGLGMTKASSKSNTDDAAAADAAAAKELSNCFLSGQRRCMRLTP